jgi:hypothetical protein
MEESRSRFRVSCEGRRSLCDRGAGLSRAIGCAWTWACPGGFGVVRDAAMTSVPIHVVQPPRLAPFDPPGGEAESQIPDALSHR